MAVLSYLAKGAKAQSNAAAITPELPSWTQASGDTVFVMAMVRENGATLSISAGWDLVESYVSATNEVAMYIWKRAWFAGMTAPTITPTGAGSNDCLLGQTIAVRGTISSISLIEKGDGTNGATTYRQTTSPAVAIVNGDVSLFFYAATNDYASVSLDQQNYQPGGAWPKWSQSGYELTTQGADATIAWSLAGWDTPSDGTSTWIEAAVGLPPDATPCYIWIKINGEAHPPPPQVKIDWLLGFDISPTYISGARQNLIVDWLLGFDISPAKIAVSPKRVAALGASWNMDGVPQALIQEGWKVSATVAGIACPLTQLTLRRSGTLLTVEAGFPGYFAPPIGAVLSIGVVYYGAGGTSFEIPVASSLVTQRRPSTKESFIVAEADGQAVKRTQWQPRRILYFTKQRIRTEVDFFVMPGDIYDDRAISETVTVIGNSSVWFTEVDCG